MQWTKEKPTRVGYYWLRIPRDSAAWGPMAAALTKQGIGPWIWHIHDPALVQNYEGGEWYGPLEPPGDPRQSIFNSGDTEAAVRVKLGLPPLTTEEEMERSLMLHIYSTNDEAKKKELRLRLAGFYNNWMYLPQEEKGRVAAAMDKAQAEIEEMKKNGTYPFADSAPAPKPGFREFL
jgi:hypothetical protein